MKRYRSLAALMALFGATTALAQDAEPFAPSGTWFFRTDARANGRPVCSEWWTFGPGDQMLVNSGEEKVNKRFRVEQDDTGLWLVTENLATNGLPDCMGQSSATVSPGENRIYLVPMNGGRVLTCPAPGRTPDGAPYVSGCYGAIMPADQVG